MKTLYKRLMAKLIVLLALPPMAAAQQARTLSIAGQSDRAAVVQINGKYYVALDSLAQMTHGPGQQPSASLRGFFTRGD